MSETDEKLIGPEPPTCLGDPGDRHRRVFMNRRKTEYGPYWICPVCTRMFKTVEVRNAPR